MSAFHEMLREVVQPCDTCDGDGRVWVHSQDPQDDYEVPCPECNQDGGGFSKSELENVDRIRRRNARFWRLGIHPRRQQQEDWS